jgi:hypothetical protein
VPPAHPFDPDSGRFTEDTNSNRLLENVRWVPYLNWVTFNDELVPYAGPRAQQRRFDRLGLRSQLWSFPGEHFTLAVLDEWEAAKRHLGSAPVERTPSRVNHAIMPDTWRPRFGLVHDHALLGLRPEGPHESGNPQTDPARGEINAISRAFGEFERPRTARVTSASGGPPAPSTVEGTRWTSIPSRPRTNALHLQLENLELATIDGLRARLDADRRLRVRIDADGVGDGAAEPAVPAGGAGTADRGWPGRGERAGGIGGPQRRDVPRSGRGRGRTSSSSGIRPAPRRGSGARGSELGPASLGPPRMEAAGRHVRLARRRSEPPRAVSSIGRAGDS